MSAEEGSVFSVDPGSWIPVDNSTSADICSSMESRVLNLILDKCVLNVYFNFLFVHKKQGDSISTLFRSVNSATC